MIRPNIIILFALPATRNPTVLQRISGSFNKPNSSSRVSCCFCLVAARVIGGCSVIRRRCSHKRVRDSRIGTCCTSSFPVKKPKLAPAVGFEPTTNRLIPTLSGLYH